MVYLRTPIYVRPDELRTSGYAGGRESIRARSAKIAPHAFDAGFVIGRSQGESENRQSNSFRGKQSPPMQGPHGDLFNIRAAAVLTAEKAMLHDCLGLFIDKNKTSSFSGLTASMYQPVSR
jgi:hypothetical protein